MLDDIKEIIGDILPDLLDKKKKRSDVVTDTLVVKGYWCGDVLRFDIKEVKSGK